MLRVFVTAPLVASLLLGVRHLITPSGRTVEVKGEVRASLIVNGRLHVFAHPVLSGIEDGVLTVRGSNRPALTTRVDAVERAEVTWHDGRRTVAAILGVSLIVSVVTVAAFLYTRN